MSLFFMVQLEDKGMVGEDDGESVWRSTSVTFCIGTAGIISEVLVDGYSGMRQAKIARDDFKLPSHLAEPLAIALYRICGVNMRMCDCEFGMGVCDVESVIDRIFYRIDAQTVLRKIRATIAEMPQGTPIDTAP